METVIRTAALCKAYHHTLAVDHLEMQVEKGAIYGFIGQNGAGKSTTFKLLAGLAHPTGGEMELFGLPFGDAAAQRRTGLLVEDAGVYPNLSATDNCTLKALALGLTKPETAVSIALHEVGLETMGRKKVKAFSMGQRRRLGLALALLGSPDLLLLDEPTNGLDPEGIRDIRALLLKLNEERGVTIVISSHILGELEKIATCYGILRAGKMVEQITAQELKARCSDYIALQTPDAKRAAALLEEKLGLHEYEVLPQGEIHITPAAGTRVEVADINAMLAQNGVAVQSIATHQQELEDYFLQRMGEEDHA